MKICMIAEGCYPYVVGGVSGWMQMMMSGLSQYEFEVYAIGVDSAQRGQFQYPFPENLTTVHETFMLELRQSMKKAKPRRFPKEQALPLRKMVCSDLDTPWDQIYHIVQREDFDCRDYLGSYDFFDAAKERYIREKLSIGFSDYLWTMRSMYLPLFSVLAREIPKADVYHAVAAGYAGMVGALGSMVYGKPFILSEHGIYTREREEELIRSKWTKGYFKEMWIRHFYAMSLFAYRQANEVVSLFEKNAQVERDLGCPEEKIKIIANGVAPEDFLSAAVKEREPDDLIHVGAVVRVTPIKDIKTMLAAFREVQNKVPEARFHILGPCDEDPDYYQECLALMKQLKLEHCEMPGRVNVRDYLPNMDILVLTSISEGQPLSILEGMLYRKPWVSTNVGSCGELLEGMSDDTLGSAGLIAPIMDVTRIAEGIVKLARDPMLRAEMGEVGYRRVTEQYRKADMFEKYTAIYESMKSKKGQRALQPEIQQEAEHAAEKTKQRRKRKQWKKPKRPKASV